MPDSNQALIIFIKNPEPGKVKTRLAASVGDAKALEIYLKLLDHTRSVAQRIDANRLLFYSSYVDMQDAWPDADFEKFVQASGDLGARMTAAFEQAFAERQQKVVIIGSDCRELTAEIVDQAFAELDRHEFVVGPALDGGYYLLGMRAFHPEVFQDVTWSSEDTLDQTLKKMIRPGQSVFMLPELSDVDYLEDWERVLKKMS